VKAKQLALVAVKTLLQPDLRFSSTYTLVGLGSRLDGGGSIAPGSPISFNSLNTLGSGNFANWNVGLNLVVPIGFRNELAQVRAARLALAQSFEVLKDQENKAHNFLARQYREVIATYKIIEARRLRRQTLANELRILTSKVESGVMLPTDRAVAGYSGDSLLDAQRLWAAALSDEYQAIVNYNVALAQFEFAKGTIQHHDRIQIAEGQIPKGAQVSAVEHERQRTRALLLRERTNPLIQHPTSPLMPNASWPDQVAPPLPALWQNGPPVNKNEATSDISNMPDAEPAPAATAPVSAATTPIPARQESVAPAAPVPARAIPERKAAPSFAGPQDLPVWLGNTGSAPAAMPQTPPLTPRVQQVPQVFEPIDTLRPQAAGAVPATPPLVPSIPATAPINIGVIPGQEDPAPAAYRLGIPEPLRELPALPSAPAVAPQAHELPQLGAPVEP